VTAVWSVGGGAGMEPSGKNGRGGEVSLAAPGHDGMPVRSRPTTALAIWSSVLRPRSLSAGSAPAARRTWTVTGGSVPDRDRQRACRINTRAPRTSKTRGCRDGRHAPAAFLSPRIRACVHPITARNARAQSRASSSSRFPPPRSRSMVRARQGTQHVSTPEPNLPSIRMPGCSRASMASSRHVARAMPAKAEPRSLGSLKVKTCLLQGLWSTAGVPKKGAPEGPAFWGSVSEPD
jgi:hypothetical protein